MVAKDNSDAQSRMLVTDEAVSPAASSRWWYCLTNEITDGGGNRR